jgi:hypothetical protein
MHSVSVLMFSGKLYKVYIAVEKWKKSMKTVGLALILSIGIVVMLLILVPIRITTAVTRYTEPATMHGQLRVGQISIHNNGWFGKHVALPEVVGCVGEHEVPLDAWAVQGETVVEGIGIPSTVYVAAGEEGVFYLIARDALFDEHVSLYYRTTHFSCLTADKQIL